MKSFLIVYDHKRRTLEVREYDESQRLDALEDRFTRELEERGRPEVEVVLIGSESLDTLKATHGHYFAGTTRVA